MNREISLILLASVFVLTAALLSGCGSVSGGSFCGIYTPVYTSPDDTEETQEQIDQNNAVYLELCDR